MKVTNLVVVCCEDTFYDPDLSTYVERALSKESVEYKIERVAVLSEHNTTRVLIKELWEDNLWLLDDRLSPEFRAMCPAGITFKTTVATGKYHRDNLKNL